MPQITALEPQRRKKDRFNLYLDGEFVFGVSTETVVKYDLRLGEEISLELQEKLIKEEELVKHLNRAYRLLSYRPRSAGELEDYFRRRQTTALLIRLVLERLTKERLVDDRRFARWWIKQRTQFRPKGALALKVELLKKRVSREVIEDVLAEYQDQLESEALVEKVARKAVKSYQGKSQREFRQKLWTYLFRRGFKSPVVKRVVDKLILETYNEDK